MKCLFLTLSFVVKTEHLVCALSYKKQDESFVAKNGKKFYNIVVFMGKWYSWLVLFILFSQNSSSSLLLGAHSVENKLFLIYSRC